MRGTGSKLTMICVVTWLLVQLNNLTPLLILNLVALVGTLGLCANSLLQLRGLL